MKLKILFVVCTSYLIANSAELPPVKLKFNSDCNVYDKSNSLFEYREERFFSFGFDEENDFNDSKPSNSSSDLTSYIERDINKNSQYHDKEPYTYIPSVKLSLINDNNDSFVFGTYDNNSFSEYPTHSFNGTKIEKLIYHKDLGDIVFSRKSPYYFDNELSKLLSSNNLFFVAEFTKFEGIPKKVKKEVYKKTGLELPKYVYKNGILIFTEPKKEYRDGIDIEDLETKVINKYRVIMDRDSFHQIQEECESSIQGGKSSFIARDLSIVTASLIGLWIVAIFIYQLYTKAKNTAKTIQLRAHEYKVQKIAEDEAIRTTVKKAVDEDSEDSKELQELINKAVSKGETETAQSLLAILERRKSKH